MISLIFFLPAPHLPETKAELHQVWFVKSLPPVLTLTPTAAATPFFFHLPGTCGNWEGVSILPLAHNFFGTCHPCCGIMYHGKLFCPVSLVLGLLQLQCKREGNLRDAPVRYLSYWCLLQVNWGRESQTGQERRSL